ncbi:MAG: T9SS type A sorting domain-containing protein [Sphingobacteriales bacterium]|nr:T9SS type A sorting domain-containing protein [Sphingobacteriales bacterium]
MNLGDYNGAVTVNVYSVTGNLLLQAQRNYAGPMLLSLGKQPAGIYVLEVITSQGKATQKIVVEK